jgi:hypothetical protein
MKDCFAYKHNGCTALKVRKCEGCSFYKTKEQYEIGQRKVLERIRSLDIDKQKYISETYYDGKLEVKEREC